VDGRANDCNGDFGPLMGGTDECLGEFATFDAGSEQSASNSSLVDGNESRSLGIRDLGRFSGKSDDSLLPSAFKLTSP
jgi:hypothetical protein